MSLKLLTLMALGLSIPEAIVAQDSVAIDSLDNRLNVRIDRDTTDLYRKDQRVFKTKDGQEYVYNTFTSGSTNVHKFDNNARAFRDWSISLGGGVSFLQRGDLTSFYDSKVTPGYNVFVSLNKQISHTFGLSLQYQFGQTKQRGTIADLPDNIIYPNGAISYSRRDRGIGEAKTEYNQISILGDLNLTSLMRRSDNLSPYRWALHAYAGLGVQGFTTQRRDRVSPEYVEITKQDLGIASFFYQGGLGLRFNLSKLIDLETRVMYIISGDDEFDGGGSTTEEWPGYNLIKKNNSDNMLTANLGLTFKLGKKGATHLSWYDPMKELYYRTELIGEPRTTICEKGDQDNDGVCDDWDRQLDTPAGARVDGAGVALDLDLDGVIDLHDKCVTTPGPVENQGCPYVSNAVIESLDRSFEGVVFDLNKYKITTATSMNKLNEAAEVMKSLSPMPRFSIIGATDTRGTERYNLVLSQRRANSVVNYLVSKGIPKSNLVAEGRGEKDLKYPECNPASACPEWKNEANRRVYIEQK